MSIGSGARQRRRDRNREHAKDASLNDYYEKMLEYISYGTRAAPLEQAVEIDVNKVIPCNFTDAYKQFSSYTDSFTDIRTLVLEFSGCEFNFSKFEKLSKLEFLERIESCVYKDPSPAAPHNEMSEYAPESPQYAPDTIEDEEPLQARICRTTEESVV